MREEMLLVTAPRHPLAGKKRIAGVELVRETGWVYLQTGRVSRAQQAMMQTLERVRPGLKLSPGPAVRVAGRKKFNVGRAT